MDVWGGHTYTARKLNQHLTLAAGKTHGSLFFLPLCVLPSISVTSMCCTYRVVRFGFFFCKTARVKLAFLTNHFPLVTFLTSH